MTEPRELLARQAAWQRELRALSWPEKIRWAEAVRESVLLLRRRASAGEPSADDASPAAGSAEAESSPG